MIGTIISPMQRLGRTRHVEARRTAEKSPGQMSWSSGGDQADAEEADRHGRDPARISRIGLTTLRTRGDAYSLR